MDKMLRTLVFGVSAVKALRILTLNDVHLDLSKSGMPMPGEDATQSLLQVVLDKAGQEQVDVILLLGDLCAHGLAGESEQSTPNWDL
jgi:hypothetical protein